MMANRIGAVSAPPYNADYYLFDGYLVLLLRLDLWYDAAVVSEAQTPKDS